MSAPGRTRVDVVGAGISGLASAYFLARSGAPLAIRVWERDATPGGLAGSFSTGIYTVEKFYHHLFRRDVALQELIAELGLGAHLCWRPAATGAYYNRRPYRLSSPLDLLRFRPLPLADRLRLGWLLVDARRHKDWRELDDLSVKDYVTRVAGRRVWEVVWEPLFRGKFGASAERISAAWLWSKIVDRGGSRSRGGRETLGYLEGGLGRVFAALCARLEELGHRVHLGRAVLGLDFASDGGVAALRVAGRDGAPERHPTDLVISGAQLPDLAALLPERWAGYRSDLNRIGFLGNVCLVLTLERSLSDFYWTNVTDTSLPFVGIVEQTNWADREDFAGRHVVYVSAYVPSGDTRMNMQADELVDFYLPHLCAMFPDFSRAWILEATCWKERSTQPIVEVGYRHLVPAIESPIPNLFVCTMAQIYPHDRQVSNGVELARRTADLVLARLARGAPPAASAGSNRECPA